MKRYLAVLLIAIMAVSVTKCSSRGDHSDCRWQPTRTSTMGSD